MPYESAQPCINKYYLLYLQFAPCKGIMENFADGIRNPGLWNPEYSSKNPKSHKRLESRI